MSIPAIINTCISIDNMISLADVCEFINAELMSLSFFLSDKKIF